MNREKNGVEIGSCLRTFQTQKISSLGSNNLGRLGLRKKEELKRKKLVKIHELTDECKKHGGLVTVTSLSLFNIS